MDVATVRRLALDWLADDPDPQTRAELTGLLAVADRDPRAAAELADRFAGPLTFGTAGLRAPMGAGARRMNRVSVGRAAVGLADWLVDTGGRAAVVGYDARAGSAAFAKDTAALLAGAGLEALVLPRPLPTPLLAFTVRRLGVDAGVMVTASHNPKGDNGYKVYLADGSQVAPPAEGALAARMAQVERLRDHPRRNGWTTLGESVVDDYVAVASELVPPQAPRRIQVVSTALHGVGGELLSRVLTAAGFRPPIPVPEQQQPDPSFPTVEHPNPEEPGVLDRALALGTAAHADLVLANDPDADRCAVAVPVPGGPWRVLSGDEVGGLLGEQVASVSHGTLASTVVSSTRLAAIAAAHEVPSAVTLTGFKWIARVPNLSFGYEEALGYCVDPAHVRDKDGLTAALAVTRLAALLAAQDRTLLDALDDLDVRYGVHDTAQVAVRPNDPATARRWLADQVAGPPHRLGGRQVLEVEDLARGVDGLPPTEGLRLRLAEQSDDVRARVVVRPSGTEAKLKAYLEVVVPVPSAAALSRSRQVGAAALGRLRHDVAGLLARAVGEAVPPA